MTDIRSTPHARGLMAAAGAILILTACTRQVYVPVERTVRDSLVSLRVRSDTMLVRDSIYMDMRGDTIVREVYRWRTRTRTRTDTVYRVRRDTVPVVIAPATQSCGKRSAGWLARVLEVVKWITRVVFVVVVARWWLRAFFRFI